MDILQRAWNLERDAAEKWGKEAQAFMVCEEAGELVTAICQFGRGRIRANELLDEAADGIIVSAAAAYRAGATVSELERAIKAKLDRLQARIAGAPGHFGDGQLDLDALAVPKQCHGHLHDLPDLKPDTRCRRCGATVGFLMAQGMS